MPDEKCAEQQSRGRANKRIDAEEQRETQARQSDMRYDISGQAHPFHERETSYQTSRQSGQQHQDE